MCHQCLMMAAKTCLCNHPRTLISLSARGPFGQKLEEVSKDVKIVNKPGQHCKIGHETRNVPPLHRIASRVQITTLRLKNIHYVVSSTAQPFVPDPQIITTKSGLCSTISNLWFDVVVVHASQSDSHANVPQSYSLALHGGETGNLMAALYHKSSWHWPILPAFF